MLPHQTELELERARVRDLLRYYKPSNDRLKKAETSKTDNPQECTPISSIPAAVEADDGPQDVNLLAHDPTLTAFAQLGAFRLNCKRAFISLMDHDRQYILAEATRSVSLNDPAQTLPGDELYLGALALERVWGVCPYAIRVFTAANDHLNISGPDIFANQQCYVMNDLSTIDGYKDKPYCTGFPFVKFYAEVPIHSPAGHVIGTFCVADGEARNGLDEHGLQAMNEVASAIMKHLELVQMQESLQRAGEMVKRLGHFVEGKSTLPQWWTDSIERNTQEASNLISMNLNPQSQSLPLPSELRDAQNMNGLAESSSTRSSRRIGPNSGPVQKPKSISTPSPPHQENGDPFDFFASQPAQSRKMSSSEAAARDESMAAAGMKELFARASNLICEALQLDGVIFVDACMHDNVAGPGVMASISAKRNRQDKGPLHRPRLIRDTSLSWAPVKDNSSKAWTEDPLQASDLLGCSLKNKSQLARGGKSSQQYIMPQSTLRSLLNEYRDGHIFFFDEDGNVIQDGQATNSNGGISFSDTSDLSVSPLSDDQAREQSIASQLLEICPGAQTIIFSPLWDPQRDQWFAGSLAWTNEPTRILQPVDLTYLAAFGSCIMAERSRLDAIIADRAKADFISSVSHELRTPLHGVLASAEALQETSTGYAQDDMIRTIAVCGQVLLDTMDHILDYAKINTPSMLRSSYSEEKTGKVALHQASKQTRFDLSSLIENVTEGIVVGNNYVKSTQNGDSESLERNSANTLHRGKSKVMTILSFSWRDSWIFESQIGGWKRILINIIGNALKYTEFGFVHISLEGKSIKHPSKSGDQTVTTLRINDSGRGMSKDYLKYKLFTPFVQEDPMSSGTGLGLSIVRQLITDLGGTIDIQSEKAIGTEVKLTIPLGSSLEESDTSTTENSMLVKEIRMKCKGLTLCLVGFDIYPNITEPPIGILSDHCKGMMALKSSIIVLAAEWFGMNILSASSFTTAEGDILIGMQSQLRPSDGRSGGQPLILFEDVMSADRVQYTEDTFCLSHPVGPQKLARVMRYCLEYISLVKSRPLEQPPLPPFEMKTPATPISSSEEDLKYKTVVTTQEIASPSEIFISIPPPVPPPLVVSSSYHVDIPGPEESIDRLQSLSLDSPARVKVLLVEDNDVNMKILMNYMKRAKQEFITAVNGLEALQKYQASPESFKVIFMDISMPVMDGLTSTRHIRTHERGNSLPPVRIVALTCFSSPEYQRDALASGVDLFLVKPVPMKTLKPILDLDPYERAEVKAPD